MAVSEAQFDQLRDRVIDLEQKYAVREETLKAIDTRLSRIESTLSRITWLIIGAIISAAIAFMLSGGLHVGVPSVG